MPLDKNVEYTSRRSDKSQPVSYASFGENLPLKADVVVGEEYPVDNLGSYMSKAAKAIHQATAAPLGLCAQSVLGAASLAVGSVAQIFDKYRRTPLNNFYFTVGKSGSGKSSAMNLAMKAHRDHSINLCQKHTEWEADMKVYARDLKDNPDIGDPPPEPLTGSYMPEDPTIEALFLMLKKQSFGGAFTPEAGGVLNGHSMKSATELVKTIAMYSNMWDGGILTRARVTDGNISIRNRRVSVHLMGQPIVSEKAFFGSAVMKGQGFLARFLMCYPEPVSIEDRFAIESSEFDATIEQDIALFQEQIRLTLEKIKVSDSFELSLLDILLSPGAKKQYLDFVYAMMKAEEGEHKNIIETVTRMRMHALKLAGTIELIDHPMSLSVSEESMHDGIKLAQFYLGEAARLISTGNDETDTLSKAQELEKWMRENSKFAMPNGTWRLRDIYRNRACGLTTAKAAETVIAELIAHGIARKQRSGNSMVIELTG